MVGLPDGRGVVTVDHAELGRFLARYTPEEWRLWVTGACAMTQGGRGFDPDRLCRDERVPGYILCEYHLEDMKTNYRRTDTSLRVPPSVTEWLSY